MYSMVKTQQESFWTSDFGKKYTERNTTQTRDDWERFYTSNWGVTRKEMNEKFVGSLPRSTRMLEVGCNSGNQLVELQEEGFTDLYGVELQSDAVEEAKARTKHVNLVCGSGFDLPFKTGFFDLVCTNGVLIHVAPADLSKFFDEMYRVSKRYIWGFEYFSDDVKDINYRGHTGFLWKANYAQMMMQQFPNLKLVKEKKFPYVMPGMEANTDCMFLLEKMWA